MGAVLWQLKEDHDKAIADYNDAIRLDPTLAAAYNNRGEAWRSKKDYDKAVADYNEAIRLEIQAKPCNGVCQPWIYWLELKNYDKAIDD